MKRLLFLGVLLASLALASDADAFFRFRGGGRQHRRGGCAAGCVASQAVSSGSSCSGGVCTVR